MSDSPPRKRPRYGVVTFRCQKQQRDGSPAPIPRLQWEHTRKSPLFYSDSDLSSEPPELEMEVVPRREGTSRREAEDAEQYIADKLGSNDNLPQYCNVTERQKKQPRVRSEFAEEEARRERRKEHVQRNEKTESVYRIYRYCNCKDHRCPQPYPK